VRSAQVPSAWLAAGDARCQHGGMPDCPVATILSAAARRLGDPDLAHLAGRLSSGYPEAPVARHRRTAAALAEAAALAARPQGAALAAVLAGDEMVVARMRVAAVVLAAAGRPVRLERLGRADLPAEALAWRRYADGPVSPVHRSCAHDVVRGLLRLCWNSRDGGRAAPGARESLAGARVRLSGRARVRCAALRAELHDEAAALTGRDAQRFAARVGQRTRAVAEQFRDSVARDLGEDVGGPVRVALPPPPAGAPYDRLTLLLGGGFAAGAALTVARLLAGLTGVSSPAQAGLSAALGLVLGGVVVTARRQALTRALADRWAGEAVSALRAALAEHLSARLLAAAAGPEPRWATIGVD
jgi:hypothetical protein